MSWGTDLVHEPLLSAQSPLAPYNYGDMDVYDLAVFTAREIRAGTELTFDYLDKAPMTMKKKTELVLIIKRARRERSDQQSAKKCHKWLWM
ncbi:MAG: hypothetical protein M1835_002304 [Candelina submexicana]|nr:MAG: hypothetical protein M1835_002304 [Candelina submexicana]